MHTLLYLSGLDDTIYLHKHIGKYSHLVKLELKWFSKFELLALEVRALQYHRVAVCRPDNKHNCCKTEEDSQCEVEKSCYRDDVKKEYVSFDITNSNLSYTHTI